MKKIISRVSVCAALLLAANGHGVLAAEPIVLPSGTLDANELRSLFSGKTVQSINIKNNQVSLTYFDPSGTVRQLHKGKIRLGKWSIKESGRICRKIENGRNKCRIVILEQDIYRKYIVKKNGQHKHIVDYRSFVTGNPHNL